MPDGKNNNKSEKGKQDKKDVTDLSPEDLQKKEDIELIVERTRDPEPGVQKSAINALRTEITSGKTSISSIPKGLKFLRAHYKTLSETFESLEGENRILLADVMSVLAMTMSTEGSLDSLKFRLQGSKTSIDEWGHEYVRNLSGEIIQEFALRVDDEKPVDDLMTLVDQIVPFNITHNAEPEACDLLLEVERLSDILNFVDEANFERICLYLLGNADYAVESENLDILRVVLQIYQKLNRLPEALFVAMRIDDPTLVKEVFQSTEDPTMKNQLAFLLGRQRYFNFEEEDEELSDLIGNAKLETYYHELAKDLSVEEPKAPKDIYKMHLIDNLANMKVDSAQQNLADMFVNAFVNVGSGADTLLLDDKNKAWIYKTKSQDRISAVASMGLLHLWDIEGGTTVLDPFWDSNDESLHAGAYFGVGLAACGVQNVYDVPLNLLGEHTSSDSPSTNRIGAILGLGLAYAGTAREDVQEILIEVLDSKPSVDILSIAAYSLGLIFVGTCNAEIAGALTDILVSSDEETLNHPYSKFMCLGLGLLYLGKQSLADVTLETLKVITGPISKYALFTVDTCAYAGTGNVLKIQEMLYACGDHFSENENADFQAVAVLGISLIAFGEEIGSAMSIRAFNHLLQYGDPVIRRTVPLALGLLSISNPQLQVMDTLSKLSHDSDADVSQGAILSLGLIGAGTNNSRIAGLLRQLSAYYCKDPNHLFTIRIAQGLLHLGKGLVSLNPFSCNAKLLSKVGLAGILGTMHACFDFSGLIHSTGHYFLYLLTCAMHPRMLITLDEDLNPLEVTVRVGQAVDTVGQAGKPKTITGFQTHTSPVLLACGERAELATDDYVPVSCFLENCVIVKPNPNKKS